MQCSKTSGRVVKPPAAARFRVSVAEISTLRTHLLANNHIPCSPRFLPLWLPNSTLCPVMRNWVFFRPLFGKVLFWGLVADWGSKGLINLLIDPTKFPRKPISQLEGLVYPYPPGHLSIAHTEHWHEHWYDLDGLTLQLHKFADWVTSFDVSMHWSGFAVLLGLPFLLSLSSIGKRRPQVALTLALAFWFVAALGNKGEVWLTGHATD